MRQYEKKEYSVWVTKIWSCIQIEDGLVKLNAVQLIIREAAVYSNDIFGSSAS